VYLGAACGGYLCILLGAEAMKLEGGQQFAKALEALPFTKQRGVLTKMLKKAAEPMRQRMEDKAPREPGKPDLADNMIIQSVSKIDDGSELEARSLEDSEVAVAVGPSKDSWYAHFPEFGTAPHGNHPGTPPQPYARPAFDETQDDVLRSLQDDIWAHLRNTAERSPGGRNL
jgi:HK97 gp10 family phage protein